jgi:hypothetical protein
MWAAEDLFSVTIHAHLTPNAKDRQPSAIAFGSTTPMIDGVGRLNSDANACHDHQTTSVSAD